MRDLHAMHSFSLEVRGGALMSYGAKVAELPFQEPTRIVLAVNLRTTRSMRPMVPPSLLAIANEVIKQTPCSRTILHLLTAGCGPDRRLAAAQHSVRC